MLATLPSIARKRFPADFAQDVYFGLTRDGQKTLPARWLYDPVGSALFEAITVLPEYGLTRADSGLLQREAASILHEAGSPSLVIELGSGTGTKTRHLLRAASAQSRREVIYRPIDISQSALDTCCASFAGMEGVLVEPVEGTYELGLEQALATRGRDQHALLLFLGSTIGNFSPHEAEDFLRRLRGHLRGRDSLLVGADLVKDSPTLLLAYDDPAGVTAAFNKNLLARINRELNADFNLALFSHVACFDERWSRIEMHLRADARQTVHVRALDLLLHFDKGETIWTESSYKFTPESLAALGEKAGWHARRQWIDRDWGFSETLLTV